MAEHRPTCSPAARRMQSEDKVMAFVIWPETIIQCQSGHSWFINHRKHTKA